MFCEAVVILLTYSPAAALADSFSLSSSAIAAWAFVADTPPVGVNGICAAVVPCGLLDVNWLWLYAVSPWSPLAAVVLLVPRVSVEYMPSKYALSVALTFAQVSFLMELEAAESSMANVSASTGVVLDAPALRVAWVLSALAGAWAAWLWSYAIFPRSPR